MSASRAASPTAVDLTQRVSELLAGQAPSDWKATGLTRDIYLDLMEPVLQTAAGWQDGHGAIIDPVDRTEHGQTSCRFVAPGAILLASGRAQHLRDHILLGMDWCCSRLANGQAQSPDFWMRELMTAWPLLKDLAPSRAAVWQEQIRSIDPEAIYWQVSRDGSRLHELRNWTVYAAAGEALRQVAGLGPAPDDGTIIWGARFFEKYMPAQVHQFSELGMYRDPNDPFTYDMTTRLQIATALAGGFSSPLSAALDDLLRRGALAQLLYVSPAGYAPFGGRSNQMHLQEAILAALSELEARRYHCSCPPLAGAFKRMAHLHALSIRRWICELSPMRHIKNGFDPLSRHGCEDYAKWSVYSLFAASCLGLAWSFANEQIPEGPAPCETGGYVFELRPAFHKIFANCGRTQIEIDTAADPHYDATGLGRLHRAGLPLELGLSMPLPAHPNYHLPADLLPADSLAIGPGWQAPGGQWIDLATLDQGLSATCEVETETPTFVAFSVHWADASSGAQLRQRYVLTPGCVEICAAVEEPATLATRFTVPLLVTDGATATSIAQSPGCVAVHHARGDYIVEFDPALRVNFGRDAANRNGVYRPLVLQCPGNTITVRLSLLPPGGAGSPLD